MKILGKMILYPALLFNAFLVGMLILCAYSELIQPRAHPIAAALGLAFPFFLVANLLFLVFWLVVSYRYALLPLAGLLICAPQIRAYVPFNPFGKTPPKESIKLLSYNVMSFSYNEKRNGKNPILSYLQESGADIICLQEYSVSGNKDKLTREDIRKALKDYPYSTIQESGQNGIHLACFSKFPILSTAPIHYQSTYNSSFCYTLKIGADTLMLVNNHLESNKLTMEERNMYEQMIDTPNARTVKSRFPQLLRKLGEAASIRSAQIDSVSRVIEDSPYPTTIACGDFNAGPISYAHHRLTRRLNDAFTRSGNGLGVSYNRNKFYFRIDNILISPNLKAYRCTVDRSIRASDHYPIWCYISKRTNS
ncbi:MAG: endonuclease/exonuclease/phosphatase family protein [Mediterranea sp.]|jgi:endonuclease/exonuclease/phosphatase family metal-dependent hydrolase|nr:endonuclease/exonuclease/phosphatase family protein [Mediterranea sp.]